MRVIVYAGKLSDATFVDVPLQETAGIRISRSKKAGFLKTVRTVSANCARKILMHAGPHKMWKITLVVKDMIGTEKDSKMG